jgi:hypothetical protein
MHPFVSHIIFLIHFPKAWFVLRVKYIHYSEAFDVFSLRHRQILYRNKIKSPE